MYVAAGVVVVGVACDVAAAVAAAADYDGLAVAVDDGVVATAGVYTDVDEYDAVAVGVAAACCCCWR